MSEGTLTVKIKSFFYYPHNTSFVLCKISCLVLLILGTTISSFATDLTACIGDAAITLNAGDTNEYVDAQWSPNTGLSSSTINNPTLTIPSTAGEYTYTFTGKTVSANKIINGDFESGNTGFTSDYNNASSIEPEGTYAVTNNVHSVHSNSICTQDHTTGTGKMMAVNGSSTANMKVWEQLGIPVTPNTNYIFYAWVMKWDNNSTSSLAQLQFSINGDIQYGTYEPQGGSCNWTQIYTVWNSGSNTSVTIKLVNQQTAAFGNDFAVDDIYFAEVTEVTKSFRVQVKDCTNPLNLSISGIKNTVCNGAATSTCTGTATVNVSGGTEPYTYLWDDPSAQNTATATKLCAGKYTVTVTDATSQKDTISYTVNNDIKTETITDKVRKGKPYNNHNFNLPIQEQEGIFTHTKKTTSCFGCDSLVTLQLSVVGGGSDLVASIDGTTNTVCNGTVTPTECQYNGPTILINEVMINPTVGNGAIYSSTSEGGEWIELYNPHKCDSIDISGYLLGNYTTNGAAGYTLPDKTVVPPLGFCIVRGPAAPSVAANLLVANGGNTVEVVVNDAGSLCVVGGDRYWLPNPGGWFAFYDREGNPQDAILWGSDTESYLDGQPCVPSGSFVADSYNTIPTSKKTRIYDTEIITNTDIEKSIRRVPDGGNWAVNEFATTVTYGTCNSTCATPYLGSSNSTCTGTATVTVSGGTEPYTYLWDDPSKQTTATATGLCAGTYTVIVTDGLSQKDTLSYTVANYVPEVSHENIVVCPEAIPVDLTTIGKGKPVGGSYSGIGISNDTLTTYDAVTKICNATYTYEENGCQNSANFEIQIEEVQDTVINATICQGTGYSDNGFSIPIQTVAQTITVEKDTANTIGCTYKMTLELQVAPTYLITETPVSICQGNTYNFRGKTLSNSGLYADTLQTKLGCDSIYQLQLTVYPTYHDTLNVTICEGETYSFKGLNLDQIGIYTDSLTTVHSCDSLVILNLDVISFANAVISDTVSICQGEKTTIEVSGYPDNSTVQWSNGSSYARQKVSPQTTTTYTATISKLQCQKVLTTEVIVNPTPQITGYNLVDETTGDIQLIFSEGTPPYSFTLDGTEGSTSGLFPAVTLGYHTAVITDENSCSGKYVFYRDITLIPDKYFSPNGDGVHDTWKIQSINLVPAHVYIYDRFSKLLAKYEDNFEEWDGTYLGNQLPSTDYWYLIKTIYTNQSYTGHFTLRR